LAAAAQHQIEWRWVRGHSGNPMNDRADALATRAREEL
jgi:ribonuclease HI